MTIRVKIIVKISYGLGDHEPFDGWVLCHIKNQGKEYKRVHHHPLGHFFDFSTYFYFSIPRKLKIEVLKGSLLKTGEVVGETSPIKFTKLINLQEVHKTITCDEGDITFSIRMAEDFDRIEKTNAYLNRSYMDLVKLLPTLSTIEKKITTTYRISCRAKNLANLDFFSKSDPFFRLNCDVSHEFSLFSGVIKDDLNPNWGVYERSFNGKMKSDAVFYLKVLDWDKKSGGELIGEAIFTYADIIEGKKEFDLYNEKKKKKQGTFIVDELVFTESSEDINPNEAAREQVVKAITMKSHEEFYLLQKEKELKMGVTIAVDFSASNGQSDNPESLHYVIEEKKSPYKKVISKVLKALKPFIGSNQYHAYGYGAKLVNQHETLPFFNLSLSEREELEGVKQVVSAYKQAIPQLVLTSLESAKNPKTGQPYHANDFYSIIDHVSQKANSASFNVLVVITTGKDVDLQSTIDSIVESSDKPLSIVLVGVGNGDFSTLKTLDADSKVLTHRNGMKANKDIVHFVNFNTTTNLVADILREIPEAYVNYYLKSTQ